MKFNQLVFGSVLLAITSLSFADIPAALKEKHPELAKDEAHLLAKSQKTHQEQQAIHNPKNTQTPSKVVVPVDDKRHS